MFVALSLLSLACAVAVLLALAVIDARTYLLPNPLVLAFAVLGVAFHFSTGFALIDPWQMVEGAATGFGLLYIIRLAASAWYKQDALGLGDVKLMGAAGLWLGPENVLTALTVGAFAGLFHGLVYAAALAIRTKTSISLRRLVIPAGPGFIAGIVLTALWQFRDFRLF